LGPEHREDLRGGRLEWLWSEIDTRGLCTMIHAPGLTDEVRAISQTHPKLRIIFSHLGIATSEQHADLRSVLPSLQPLAQCANVAVSATALPSATAEVAPYPYLFEAVAGLVTMFGSARVFWGSDLSRLPIRYDHFVDLVSHTSQLSEPQRRDFLGAALVRWVRWPALVSRLAPTEPDLGEVG
jgi:L-fuconolactonase